MNPFFFLESPFVTHFLAYLAGVVSVPSLVYGGMQFLGWYERRRLGLDEPSPEDDL